MNKEKKCLKNAPIKEVIIGISSDELFKSFEDIEEFFKNSSLNEKFKPIQELKRFALEMNGKDAKFNKTISIGKGYENKNKSERINIELDRIMFIDRSKYTNFKTLSNKFYLILEEIFKFKKCTIKTNDIGLKYTNVFDFTNDKLKEKFYIKPIMSYTNSENKIYGKQLNSAFMSQIQSTEYNNAYAIIQTVISKISGDKYKIIFDIDTHTHNIEIQDVNSFKKEILKLKEFKNEIFFSNFDNAYTIEEFN